MSAGPAPQTQKGRARALRPPAKGARAGLGCGRRCASLPGSPKGGLIRMASRRPAMGGRIAANPVVAVVPVLAAVLRDEQPVAVVSAYHGVVEGLIVGGLVQRSGATEGLELREAPLRFGEAEWRRRATGSTSGPRPFTGTKRGATARAVHTAPPATLRRPTQTQPWGGSGLLRGRGASGRRSPPIGRDPGANSAPAKLFGYEYIAGAVIAANEC